MNPIFRQYVWCSEFEYDKSTHLFRVHISILIFRLLLSIPFCYRLSFSRTDVAKSPIRRSQRSGADFATSFWGFAFGREIEAQKLVLLLKFNWKTTVEFCTSARLTQNHCACCTTQIYKNLYKNWIFRKFKYARKEEFYAPIICFG